MDGEGDGGRGKEPQPKILFLCDVNVAAGGHVDLSLPHSSVAPGGHVLPQAPQFYCTCLTTLRFTFSRQMSLLVGAIVKDGIVFVIKVNVSAISPLMY